MKQVGSFICALGWISLFMGYVLLALGLLIVGFTLVLSDRR